MTSSTDSNSPDPSTQYSALTRHVKEHYTPEWHDDITLNVRMSRRHRLGFRLLGRFYCLLLASGVLEKYQLFAYRIKKALRLR